MLITILEQMGIDHPMVKKLKATTFKALAKAGGKS
jgi:hypothetical protein